MEQFPLTKNQVGSEQEERIRDSIRNTQGIAGFNRIANKSDADAFTTFLSDPQLAAPISSLPQEINIETISAFIEKHLEERALGDGLLMLAFDDESAVEAYHDVQFWPQWAACKLGGAIRGDQQSSGKGSSGAMTAFNWLFEHMGMELVCETGALDNIRTAKLLERIGFKHLGEVDMILQDGGTRPSNYWELTKDDFMALQASH